MRTILIGTRGSALALAQAELVRSALSSALPCLNTGIVPIRTTGDILSEVPLDDIGGKGVFVKDIEKQLLEGRIDIAVHSLKDMQASLPDGLAIGAYLKREDPRDMLFTHDGFSLETLPPGARIGTSSMRRRCQLKALRPDLTIVDIRGNVATRLRKLAEGLDAVILAAAGVIRLNLPLGVAIDTQTMVPSPGQGIIAVESRFGDAEISEMLGRIDHADTRPCAEAERAFLGTLGQDCRLPAGAYATLEGEGISIEGMLATSDERQVWRMTMTGKTPEAGSRLAEYLKEQLEYCGGS
jgi:hydroxymethylbilane synthase